jgi:hypothetical protein
LVISIRSRSTGLCKKTHTIRPPQKTFLIFSGSVTHDNSTISKSQNFQNKNLPVFTLSALSSPQKDSSFLNMMSPSSLSLLFLLYNAHYLKSLTRLSIVSIVKRGGNCHNPILGYSPKINSLFFKIKIK